MDQILDLAREYGVNPETCYGAAAVALSWLGWAVLKASAKFAARGAKKVAKFVRPAPGELAQTILDELGGGSKPRLDETGREMQAGRLVFTFVNGSLWGLSPACDKEWDMLNDLSSGERAKVESAARAALVRAQQADREAHKELSLRLMTEKPTGGILKNFQAKK